MDRREKTKSTVGKCIASVLILCLLFSAAALAPGFAGEKEDLDRVRKEISETQVKY
jgi:hypothetical protein